MRRVNKIHYTSVYLKSYQKLPKHIQETQNKKEKLFRENVHNPSVKTHKLKGRYKKYYSYSVTRSYRVIFRFIKQNEALFYDIGTHKIYQ